jgi:hypothetical protein
MAQLTKRGLIAAVVCSDTFMKLGTRAGQGVRRTRFAFAENPASAGRVEHG